MKIFHLPDLGEGLTEAEIHAWHVEVGQSIEADAPMVSVETAKAIVEVPAPWSGVVTTLHGAVGEVIATGAALVSFEGEASAATVVGQLSHQAAGLAKEEAIVTTSKLSHTREGIAALPSAHHLARQLQINLKEVKGNLPYLTPRDVLKHAQQHPKTATNTPTIAGEPLRGVRRSMAEAMSASHAQVVPVTVNEIAKLSAWVGKQDVTLRVIRAIIHAHQVQPALNAWFDGKHLQLHEDIHLGLGMDVDDALFVPVLKSVNRHTPQEWRETIDTYKAQLKSRSMKSEDLRGSTFMLSNFGMFTGFFANPIVVPPNVAILGTGRLRETPVVTAAGIVAAKTLPLSLSLDHRAVTGKEATTFLAALIEDLERAE